MKHFNKIKSLIVVLTLCLLYIVSNSFAEEVEEKENYWTPLQLSLTTKYQLFKPDWNVYGLKFNFINGYNNYVKGLNLGILTSNCDNLDGISIGGFLSGSSTSMNGVQISTFINGIGDVYIDSSSKTGLNQEQSSILKSRGIQASIFFNYAYYFSGIQICFGNSIIADTMNGLQLSFCGNICENNTNGLQLGCLNLCKNEMNGLQLGLMNRCINSMSGLQLSAINLSNNNMNGLQIGIYNYSKYGKGIQIGLINYMKNSSIPVVPIINFKF